MEGKEGFFLATLSPAFAQKLRVSQQRDQNTAARYVRMKLKHSLHRA